MKKILIALVLITSPAMADRPITGWVEGRRFWGNKPEYPDLTGEHTKYGLDLQLNFPTFFDPVSIMAGSDAATGQNSFSQIAGRFGADVKLWDWNVGVYHRSNHAIDHTPVRTPFKFVSENYIYVRYNFQVTR